MNHEVAIHNKVALTIEETAAYSNIGEKKLRELVKNPRCPFALYIGRKILIKRKEFDEFISKSIEL